MGAQDVMEEALESLAIELGLADAFTLFVLNPRRDAHGQSYLIRAIFMSTWGVLPAVFRPLRTVFPGLGAGFLNLAGRTERTAKKRGRNEQKWARNGLKGVGAS